MPLFCLVGAGNFRFISLLPFFSIVGILSVQAISSQILYTFFPRFPWWAFIFPVISTSVISHIWELMSSRMTWPYHRRWFWTIISSIITTISTLLQRTSVGTLSTSLTPHVLIIQRSTPCNLALSRTIRFHVSQQYNKTGLTQDW